jgi:hypothetical protein
LFHFLLIVGLFIIETTYDLIQQNFVCLCWFPWPKSPVHRPSTIGWSLGCRARGRHCWWMLKMFDTLLLLGCCWWMLPVQFSPWYRLNASFKAGFAIYTAGFTCLSFLFWAWKTNPAERPQCLRSSCPSRSYHRYLSSVFFFFLWCLDEW